MERKADHIMSIITENDGTTIRQYRLVKGMTTTEAIQEVALIWTYRVNKPTSLTIYTQHVDDPFYATYTYECRSLEAAVKIILGTKWDDGFITRLATWE